MTDDKNDPEKGSDGKSCNTATMGALGPSESVAQGTLIQTDQLLRRLNNRQVQLIAIGM